jgi:putative ATPase
LPEAQYHLAEATLYLTLAPKSNSCGAYWKALAAVEKEGEMQVPTHLQDATRDGKALGHGKDYQYPHDFPGHWVEQNYLPEALRGKTFYAPGDQGHEKEMRDEWRRRRGEKNERDP